MDDRNDIFKEQVRNNADIVKVVSEYVSLKRKGGRYWGCCPFHGEKTPSFTVDEQKGFFHCFGCGLGGDVFSFVMKMENKSFREALLSLAEKFNVPIPENAKSKEEAAREAAAAEVYHTNELAMQFFQACLQHTSYGQRAQEYLEQRGITAEIRAKFSLGLAPPDYNALHTALQKKGCKLETIVKAGLANRNQRGNVYDKFRGRIMIPIKNARGKVVAFGGRIFGEGEPKYLNTGETEWFSKRNLLFGLDTSMKAIKAQQQAVVVEGYMDAISLHAAGITWAVASLGTALSEEQVRILKRLTSEVIFSFDNDRAGLAADMRAVGLAVVAELPCKVLVVPEGKDPDEFIRKRGRAAYEELIAQAPSGLSFQIESTVREYDSSELTGKVQAINAVLPFLLNCPSDIEVAQHIRNLAHRLTIDEGLIQAEYTKLARQKKRTVALPVQTSKLTKVQSNVGELAERHLLALLFMTSVKKLHAYPLALQEEAYSTPARKNIFRVWQEFSNESGIIKPASIFGKIDAEAQNELSLILQIEIPAEDLEKQKMLEDCLLQLELRHLEKEFAEHSNLANLYEKQGNENFLKELRECQRIKNSIKELSARNTRKEGTHSEN